MEINKTYCENCLDTMARMPDNFIDLTVTSPPYDDMDADFNPIPKNGLRTYKGYTWDFKAIAKELYRVTKEGGVVVWVVGDMTINGSESLASCYQKIYFRQVGFNIHDTMIYEKNGPAYPSSDKYYQIFEYMIVLSKGFPSRFNPIKDRENFWAGKKWSKKRTRRNKDGLLTESNRGIENNPVGIRFNIVRYNNGAGYSAEETFAFEHPAIFPEQLAVDHIISWSDEGNLIYDPFMGSGTTAKMAIKLKRNWLGSEISTEYCKLIEKRLDPILRQGNLF